MKQSVFLLFAALIALFFGVSMMFMPEKLLGNMMTDASPAVAFMMQLLGTNLAAVACMLFLARNDTGSPALRAIMVGNIVLHMLALIFDARGAVAGFVSTAGMISGSIVHVLLSFGFAYFLLKSPKQA